MPQSTFRLAALGTDAEERRFLRVDGPLRDPHAVPLSTEELERPLREAGAGK